MQFTVHFRLLVLYDANGSTGVIVSTLGAGFTPVLRSVTTSIVELQQTSQTSTIGRLYALIGIMEGLGNLAGGPSMAWAFVTGMGWGSAWLGLPFALATLLFVIVSLVLIRIQPSQ